MALVIAARDRHVSTKTMTPRSCVRLPEACANALAREPHCAGALLRRLSCDCQPTSGDSATRRQCRGRA